MQFPELSERPRRALEAITTRPAAQAAYEEAVRNLNSAAIGRIRKHPLPAEGDDEQTLYAKAAYRLEVSFAGVTFGADGLMSHPV